MISRLPMYTKTPAMRKIVIIGPESTGKSTLCAQLAAHYQTLWVAEHAREYLLDHGKDYDLDDLTKIAHGQLAAEDSLVNQLQTAGKSVVFIDTDMHVMKVWSEIVFGSCNNGILTAIAQRPYDAYLLCNTDLPWIEDELREYPDLQARKKIFRFYLDAMINQDVPWYIIEGNYEQRLQSAIAAVDTILLT